MANRAEKLKIAHLRRKMRVRKKISGTAERPRLVVDRSLRYMRVSLVDDDRGMTMFGASTRKLPEAGLDLPEKADKFKTGKKKLPLVKKVGEAFQLGMFIAQMAKDKGIDAVVFDRNGYRYHGRVRAIAEGARKGGLAL
ncbi:50S ribosomal protein L18 [bacterium BMS3Bbin04]|nr:50S ribosomal protein L18 [bacterium BMS3Bbin04]